jgi:serine/threonine-protein kinase
MFGGKLSARLNNHQTSDGAESETLLPPTHLYKPTQEETPTPPLENDQAISPHKLALLIGLILGVGSGLILMVVTYWSVQIITDPKIQNSTPESPEVSR